jgi:hypothetical protein
VTWSWSYGGGMKRNPTKDRRVVFLMAPADHDELVRKADLHGMSVGEYIRAALEAFEIRGEL